MAREKKYSLWYIEHESSSYVSAQKHKDTNSEREVDKWMAGNGKAASFYREEEDLNAEYIQFFPEQ